MFHCHIYHVCHLGALCTFSNKRFEIHFCVAALSSLFDILLIVMSEFGEKKVQDLQNIFEQLCNVDYPDFTNTTPWKVITNEVQCYLFKIVLTLLQNLTYYLFYFVNM